MTRYLFLFTITLINRMLNNFIIVSVWSILTGGVSSESFTTLMNKQNSRRGSVMNGLITLQVTVNNNPKVR